MKTRCHRQQGAFFCLMRLLMLFLLPTIPLLGTADIARAQGVSTGDGIWVWQNPLPQGNDLNGVWAYDADNVWAVGEYGAILYWNGVTWREQSSGVTSSLLDVWGSDPNHVWAVGVQGIILHWDGQVWTRQYSGAGLYHWLNGVWGVGDDNVWVVGTECFRGYCWHTTLKWDGNTWSNQSHNVVGGHLDDVWGADGDNIWAVGATGLYRERDGGAEFSEHDPTQPSSAGTILKWDGNEWVAQVSGGGEYRGVWGADGDNVWAVGESGAILKWNGAAWIDQSVADGVHFQDVWGVDANHVWAVASDKTFQWDGSNWSEQITNIPDGGWLHAVGSAAFDDAWAVGAHGTLLKWDGAGWNTLSSAVTTDNLADVWGGDPNNVWAVSDGGAILKWGGGAWNIQYSDQTKSWADVWGSDLDNVWAVGNAGNILKWNGTAWAAQDSDTSASLNAVWGADPDNVWAVGCNGAILKWNGATWNTQISNMSGCLYAIWGSDANHVWAVGDAGAILKWDGQSWTPQDSGAVDSLLDIWGADASNVWAVGANGAIRRWDGSAWGNDPDALPNTYNTAYAIWGSDLNHRWIATSVYASPIPDGVILEWNGNGWEQVPVHTPLLYGLWGSATNDVWAVGENGTILRQHTEQLRLNLAGSGSGVVTRTPSGHACSDNCVAYTQGVTITLTVMPYPGSSLAGWSGDCSGAGSCYLVMDASRQVTATLDGHSELSFMPLTAR